MNNYQKTQASLIIKFIKFVMNFHLCINQTLLDKVGTSSLAGGKTGDLISPAKAAKSRAGSGLLFWSHSSHYRISLTQAPLKSAEMASGVLSINEFESLTRSDQASYASYKVSINISHSFV